MDFAWKLLTLFVASVAAWVALQQYRVARDKLRLDLFAKRYEVYRGAVRYVSDVLREGNAPTARSLEFLRDTADAEFLFGPEVNEYLRDLYLTGIRLDYLRTAIKQADGPERTKRLDEHSALLDRFLEAARGKSARVFGLYLQFGDVRREPRLEDGTWWRRRDTG